MDEKKPRLSLTGAIVILSISILLSAFIISSAIRDSSIRNVEHGGTYQTDLMTFNDNFEELIKTLQQK